MNASTKTIGVEPISVSSGQGDSRLVVLGYVPESATEWDYTLPGSGRVVARFSSEQEGSKLLALYPASKEDQDSFHPLTLADIAEIELVAREALVDPEYAV